VFSTVLIFTFIINEISGSISSSQDQALDKKKELSLVYKNYHRCSRSRPRDPKKGGDIKVSINPCENADGRLCTVYKGREHNISVEFKSKYPLENLKAHASGEFNGWQNLPNFEANTCPYIDGYPNDNCLIPKDRTTTYNYGLQLDPAWPTMRVTVRWIFYTYYKGGRRKGKQRIHHCILFPLQLADAPDS